MGNNYKERAAYAYLHDIGRNIPRKLLYRIKRKWWRNNFDIGEMRKKRKKNFNSIKNRYEDNSKTRFSA